MTDYITFAGNKYLVRELRLTEYEVDVRISGESLEAVLLDADGEYVSREAQLIDEIIFFYVPDHLLTEGSDEEVEQYVLDNLAW